MDDLYPYIAAPQLEAIRSAALASANSPQDNQSIDDVFAAQMPSAARRIRQYIASNPRNRLSETENSVPPECVQMLVWFTLQDMFVRLSIAMALTQDQKDAIRTCEDDLDKIRSITPPWLAISSPVDPEEESELSLGVKATVVRSSCRQMTRTSLHAL